MISIANGEPDLFCSPTEDKYLAYSLPRKQGTRRFTIENGELRPRLSYSPTEGKFPSHSPIETGNSTNKEVREISCFD
jgi:hypothetical protein